MVLSCLVLGTLHENLQLVAPAFVSEESSEPDILFSTGSDTSAQLERPSGLGTRWLELLGRSRYTRAVYVLRVS